MYVEQKKALQLQTGQEYIFCRICNWFRCEREHLPNWIISNCSSFLFIFCMPYAIYIMSRISFSLSTSLSCIKRWEKRSNKKVVKNNISTKWLSYVKIPLKTEISKHSTLTNKTRANSRVIYQAERAQSSFCKHQSEKYRCGDVGHQTSSICSRGERILPPSHIHEDATPRVHLSTLIAPHFLVLLTNSNRTPR